MAEKTHCNMKILVGRKQLIHGHLKEALTSAHKTPLKSFQKERRVVMTAFINRGIHFLEVTQQMNIKVVTNPSATAKDQSNHNNLPHWAILHRYGMSKLCP
uniref:Putative suppressor of ty n=1 Tax=Culex tarsalis TaxID=7177 RepID=A0A1Q3F7P4_CULTA